MQSIVRCLIVDRGALLLLLFPDGRTKAGQFLHQPLIAAFQMVNTGNIRTTAGGKTGNDK